MGYSVIYLRSYFLGTIGNLIYNMGAAILRAVGDSKRPLYFLIASCFTNIFLDLLFVVVFHMNVAGAAIATIISCLLYTSSEAWIHVPEKVRSELSDRSSCVEKNLSLIHILCM